MSVRTEPVTTLSAWRDWIEARPCPWRQWLTDLSEAHRRALYVADLDGPGTPLLTRDGDGPLAVARLQHLDWDTRFLGAPVARVHRYLWDGRAPTEVVRGWVDAARREGVAHLVLSLARDDAALVAAAEELGLQRVMTLKRKVVDLRRPDPAPLRPRPPWHVRAPSPEDRAPLEATARAEPAYNWLDHLPRAEGGCAEPYALVRLRACLAGDFARVARVAVADGELLGFHASDVEAVGGDDALRISRERETLVVPRGRGTPAGPLALSATLAELARMGVGWGTGNVRAENEAMDRLLEARGYRTVGGRVLLVCRPAA